MRSRASISAAADSNSSRKKRREAARSGRSGRAAAAALVGAGEGIRGAGQSRAALPVEAALAAHDPRLVRERAWRPLLSSLRGGDGFHVVGIPAAAAAAFGAERAAGALAGAAGVI